MSMEFEMLNAILEIPAMQSNSARWKTRRTFLFLLQDMRAIPQSRPRVLSWRCRVWMEVFTWRNWEHCSTSREMETESIRENSVSKIETPFDYCYLKCSRWYNYLYLISKYEGHDETKEHSLPCLFLILLPVPKFSLPEFRYQFCVTDHFTLFARGWGYLWRNSRHKNIVTYRLTEGAWSTI